MSDDFDRVRDIAADSWIVRSTMKGALLMGSAWRTSSIGGTLRSTRAELAARTVTARIRWAATVIAVAALGHLALRLLLSATVRPALPQLVIAAVAISGGIVAWRADAFARAWQHSRVARYFS